jgi:flagellar hook-associated protein 2
MASLGTISGLGVGSKLDLQGTLDKLRQVDDAAVTTLQGKETKAKAQLVAFDSVNAKFLAVKAHALALSLASNFLTKKISGTDDSVASATVALGISDETHDLEVVQLATKSSFQSVGVATASTAVTTSDTTFAYKLGVSGQTINVAVSANTTLTQLADLINKAPNNPDVTASVIDSGTGTTPFRLVLIANKTGENNRISIVTPLTDLSLTEHQGAGGSSLNASLKVDGVTYERQSNSGITDVLQGVTLNLKATGSTSLQITSDTTSIADSVKGLVKAFQEAVQEVATRTAYDNQTGTFGPLANSSAMQGLSDELRQLLGTRLNTGGAITSLFDLGLEFNRDGSITLNEDTLTKALADHPDDVKTLFAGQTGVTGLGTLLTDRLSNLTQPSSGTIATEKQATQAQIDRLEANITATKARLDRRYDTLARQFARLDQYAAKMQQQGDYLSSIITSFNNLQKSTQNK